jgi:RimJ/RimL family protein N-acetyltransferase
MINFGHGIKLDTINYPTVSIMREWRNDFRIWQWCRQNDLISQDSHQEWANSLKDRHDVKMYAIKDENYGVVGVCGLTDICHFNQRAEFSLYIAPECHEKGYGKKALMTLLSHGFMNLNLHVIWGETFDGNHAFEMFLCLGMTHEGSRRDFYYKNGKFIDANLVSMTKQDYMEVSWKKSQE